MTKQDILNMTTSRDIMKAMAANRSIWDEDLSNHLRDVKRQENAARFGDADAIYTPNKRTTP